MSSWHQRWSELGLGQRILLVLVAVVVFVNLLPAAFGSVLGGGNPGGPVSSSFATDEDGLAGYADLLRASGHPVTQLRTSVSESPLDPEATVVVADPDQISEGQAIALAEFLADGGRLVLAGESAAPLVGALTGTAIERREVDAADALDAWVPDAALGGARVVAGDAGGRWQTPGPLLPLVGDGGESTLVTTTIGGGQLLALTDAGPLHNEHLASDDNAALGLGLAGPDARPVVFVESVHGYGTSGLDAIPSTWKAAGLGLLVALAVGLWAAAARFGPPEPAALVLRPPRLQHVQAVAANLERVSPPASTVPVDPPPGEPPP